MSRKVKLPTLVGETLKDRWYIGFSVFDERTGKLKRFRKYRGFDQLNTIEERRRYGLAQVRYWEAKLRDKKYNPFENEIVVMEDSLEYKISTRQMKVSRFNTRYFLNMYLQEKSSTLRKQSFETYQSKSRIFLSWLENESKHEYHPRYLSIKEAEKFSQYLLKERKVHHKSHNSYIQTMYSIWSYWKRKNVITNNIWKEVTKQICYSKSKRPFSPSQSSKIRDFLSRSNPWLLFFCEFQYHTCIRPCSEQPFIRISDIDFTTQELIVRGEISKNRKTQRVAIPDDLMKRIQDFELLTFPADYFVFGKFGPSAQGVGNDYFSKLFRMVLNELGINREWSMYSWKHTMNQRAAMQGIPLKELQMQNRHHSLDQFDEYLKGLTVRDAKNLFTNLPKM